ncbi:hypothetical protein BG004_000945 [Podila humilis]|nr:hypothetical protein BG004_000945 [Podila humilis]
MQKHWQQGARLNDGSRPLLRMRSTYFDNNFWAKAGIDTFIDWYTVPANYKLLKRKHGDKKIQDVQWSVAKLINSTHTTEHLSWVWKDIKNTIGYTKTQYKKAKRMKERTDKEIPNVQNVSGIDRLDLVLAPDLFPECAPIRQYVTFTVDNSNNVRHGKEVEIEDDDDDDYSDQDLSEVEATDTKINCFYGGAEEKEEFHQDMAQQKEDVAQKNDEFYDDMMQKMEEFYNEMAQKEEMNKVMNDREKYVGALAEVKVLQKELELTAFAPPNIRP